MPHWAKIRKCIRNIQQPTHTQQQLQQQQKIPKIKTQLCLAA